jgi:hypothetical protein
MTLEHPALGRLRDYLIAQVGPPLVVGDRARQYYFDEDHAAHCEIDVKRLDAFVLVVVLGALPSEEFVTAVWQRYADEVWLLDTQDEQLTIARREAPIRVLDRTETITSPALPGVAIAVDVLFQLPS